jgi:hypothetical protein
MFPDSGVTYVHDRTQHAYGGSERISNQRAAPTNPCEDDATFLRDVTTMPQTRTFYPRWNWKLTLGSGLLRDDRRGEWRPRRARQRWVVAHAFTRRAQSRLCGGRRLARARDELAVERTHEDESVA